MLIRFSSESRVASHIIHKLFECVLNLEGSKLAKSLAHFLTSYYSFCGLRYKMNDPEILHQQTLS